MTGGELLPATAWEQAAIIGIFVVFVGVLLAWFDKQASKWQKFISEIDDKWRKFNKEQRDENRLAMANVEGSLQDLTTVTQALVSEVKEMRSDTSVFFSEFHQHDEETKKILEKVNKPARNPRTKKAVSTDGNEPA